MSKTPWKFSPEEEYRRCPEIKKSEVAMIQDWLAKQPHLPEISENHIIVYLRACKFSLEKTKEAIDLNFTIRTRYPDFFSARRLDKIPLTVKNLEVMASPEKDKNGNVVVFFRLKPMELSEWSFADFTKLSFMSQDACNWELGSAPGYVFVHDIKNLTFGQIINSPISLIAASLKYSQEASACSIRGIHILNGGTIFEKLFTVIKPFLNQEVIDVMKVHPNYNDMVAMVGAQAVPKEYGGTGPSVSEGYERMIELIKKYQESLVEEESQRVDEKKRPEGSKAGDFGIQGSFRKIEVD
ncbi:transfer protein [Nesidiocoris tenuis]|uniref:Transfer protein n=1 Tax=Nesidiocoris tenuis TaxID=355587 RepID=A0ABN7AV28_9HEMI|nr:transfer protein [Nesidiocoris tenuis]